MNKKVVYAAFAAGLVGAYVLGGLTVQNEYFPYHQYRMVRNAISPPKYVPKPRVTVFETFAPDVDVVMIGDSITNGGEWTDIFPHLDIANRGIGGDKTSDVLYRLDSILATKPGKAFLMMGTNDIANNVSVAHILDNYKKIVERLRENQVAVFIQSTLECNLALSKSCKYRIEKIRELNAELEQYAQESGAVYIELNDSMASSDSGLYPDLTYDGIHLVGQGYRRWSEVLAKYL